MIHHFIHIGDAHLQHASPRHRDRIAALDQIVIRARELSEEDALAGIIWPGDLFHAKTEPEDRNTLAENLQWLSECAPVLIIPGNHDQPGDLDIFAHLATRRPITIVDRPHVIELFSDTGLRVVCFCLPYVHKSGLVASGVAHAALGQSAAELLDAIFVEAGTELASADVRMMAMHLNVGGARTGPGQPSIGREIELTPALLARIPLNTPILANHIHVHQEIQRVVYTGSLTRLDFGENDPKGFVEWTYDDESKRWAWEFRPLDVPAQWLIDGRLTRDGFIPDAPLPVMAGADVKVRYRFTQADVSVLSVAHIHAAVAGCRSLRLEAVPELEHTVRAPEIAAAATLEDKVWRCAELQGVPVTEGLRAKLDAVQNQDASAILSALDDHPAHQPVGA